MQQVKSPTREKLSSVRGVQVRSALRCDGEHRGFSRIEISVPHTFSMILTAHVKLIQ